MEGLLPIILLGVLLWVVYGCVCSQQKKAKETSVLPQPNPVKEENVYIANGGEKKVDLGTGGKEFVHEENILPVQNNPNAFQLDLPDYEDNFLAPQNPPEVGSFLGHVPTEVEQGDRVMVGDRRCTIPKLGSLGACVDQECGMSNYRQCTNNVRYDHNNCDCRANDLCQLPQERAQSCQKLYQ